MFFNQHQAIGTNTKSTIADFFNLIFRKRVAVVSIINQNKVVTGCLIFCKWNFHKKREYYFTSS